MSRAPVRLLPLGLAAALAACSPVDLASQGQALLCGMPTVEAPATRPVDPCLDGGVVAGPHRFTRATGAPTPEALAFDTAGEAQACVRLTTGGPGEHHLASATFDLDGTRLLGPAALDDHRVDVERRLVLPAGHHQLTATLRGKPGTWADVTVRAGGGGAPQGLVLSRHLALFDLFADPAELHAPADTTRLSADGAVLAVPGWRVGRRPLTVRWRFEVYSAASCALVRTLGGETALATATFSPEATWDGNDEAGVHVPAGSYAYRLVAQLLRTGAHDGEDHDDDDDDHHGHHRHGHGCGHGDADGGGDGEVLDTLATPLQTVKYQPLFGWVDLHAHPMSYLGFGGKAVHGAPDVGLPMPAGTLGCNGAEATAQTIDQALGSCNGTHGGWGLDNLCGDTIRQLVVNHGVDGDFAFKTPNLFGDHQHAGSPGFPAWPHQTSLLHQQMWWEWVKRAHQGGLRVMVALTVNNELLAELLNGNRPFDDRSVAERQIAELKRWVANHPDFMEVALSPADLDRIVGEGKLAVVMGMEVDRIGNFGVATTAGPDAVRAELRHLHELGIRYVFPVHLVDNAFGGAAVYTPLFSFANKRANGYHFLVRHSEDPLVTYSLAHVGDVALFPGAENASLLGIEGLLLSVGLLPAPCFDVLKGCFPPLGVVACCGSYGTIVQVLAPSPEFDAYALTPPGHVNVRGLTPLGEVAIDELMKLGMLIDLDHMSDLTMERVVEKAEAVRATTGGPGYPLMFGHSGIRGAGSTERLPARRFFQRVAALGGMVGAGTGDLTPDAFLASYRDLLATMGPDAVGLGTDVDGFVRLPRNADGCALGADAAGSAAFYQSFLAGSGLTSKSSTGTRTWDYVLDCGVSHYGLMPEWLYDVKTFHGGDDAYQALMRSTLGFSRTWKQAEAVAAQLP